MSSCSATNPFAVKHAATDHPVHDVIAARFSPYGFAERPVADTDLRSLFEAARWAPSSFNEQPWHFLVARREETRAFERLASCLIDFNRSWAATSSALVLTAVRRNFAANGAPNPAAVHDLGLATAGLMFEAVARGLRVHAMIGIHPERTRQRCDIPDGFDPLTALALGYPGTPATLPEKLRERDRSPRRRRPLGEFVYGAAWGRAAPFLR